MWKQIKLINNGYKIYIASEKVMDSSDYSRYYLDTELETDLDDFDHSLDNKMYQDGYFVPNNCNEIKRLIDEGIISNDNINNIFKDHELQKQILRSKRRIRIQDYKTSYLHDSHKIFEDIIEVVNYEKSPFSKTMKIKRGKKFILYMLLECNFVANNKTPLWLANKDWHENEIQKRERLSNKLHFMYEPNCYIDINRISGKYYTYKHLRKILPYGIDLNYESNEYYFFNRDYKVIDNSNTINCHDDIIDRTERKYIFNDSKPPWDKSFDDKLYIKKIKDIIREYKLIKCVNDVDINNIPLLYNIDVQQ